MIDSIWTVVSVVFDHLLSNTEYEPDDWKWRVKGDPDKEADHQHSLDKVLQIRDRRENDWILCKINVNTLDNQSIYKNSGNVHLHQFWDYLQLKFV